MNPDAYSRLRRTRRNGRRVMLAVLRLIGMAMVLADRPSAWRYPIERSSLAP